MRGLTVRFWGVILALGVRVETYLAGVYDGAVDSAAADPAVQALLHDCQWAAYLSLGNRQGIMQASMMER